MRLTSFTDYTLRTLLYLGVNRDRLVTIQDIADMHAISKNHLMKVVYQLGLSGIIETVRGRNGGMRLKQEPADINMAECFDREHDTCPLTPNCALKGALGAATKAYLTVLDQLTLADILPQTGTVPAEAIIHFHPRS